MKIQESGEMYLEAILMLKNNNTHVRAIDIANYTGYSKPSVSRALGILKKGEFITVDENGFIELKVKEEIYLEKREEQEWVYLASFYKAEYNIAEKILNLEKSKNICDFCQISQSVIEFWTVETTVFTNIIT